MTNTNKNRVMRSNVIDRITVIDDDFVREILCMWKDCNRKGKLYYILDEDRIVSFVLVEQGEEWTIRGTWTDFKYRGRGLSTRLLNFVIEEFDRFNKGWLWVNITPGAESLYEKTGFRIYGKRTDTDPPMSVGVYSRFKEQELGRFKNKYMYELKS